MEPDYAALYRESDDLSDFILRIVMAGGTEEEAVDMWYELTAKYEDRS